MGPVAIATSTTAPEWLTLKWSGGVPGTSSSGLPPAPLRSATSRGGTPSRCERSRRSAARPATNRSRGPPTARRAAHVCSAIVSDAVRASTAAGDAGTSARKIATSGA